MKNKIRKPYLPPGTTWMLRCIEPEGASPHRGKWLEVCGWNVEWGKRPSYCCPVFRNDNIADDFHWGLYSRFTAKQARKERVLCALVEVITDPVTCHWQSTGRIRRHANLSGYVCLLHRGERQAWLREQRKNMDDLNTRAMGLLKKMSSSDWIRAAAPKKCEELSEMDLILNQLPSDETLRHIRSRKVREERKIKIFDSHANH